MCPRFKYDHKTTKYYGVIHKQKLFELIDKFGVSLVALSKKTDISYNTFAKMKKGEKGALLWRPDLLEVLELFHISLDDFIKKPINQMGGYVATDLLYKRKRAKKKLFPGLKKSMDKVAKEITNNPYTKEEYMEDIDAGMFAQSVKVSNEMKELVPLPTSEPEAQSNAFSIKSDGETLTIEIKLK